MTAIRDLFDPGAADLASELLGKPLDPLRAICLALPDDAACVAALAGLANASGGHLLLGAAMDEAGETVRDLPGVEAAWSADSVRRLAERLDPPLSPLVAVRPLPLTDGRAVLVVSVRQSADPPHLDSATGLVFVHGPAGTAPLLRRADLDRLYHKGRARHERAERVVEAAVERLSLAQFGHYATAVVAALSRPTAEPYLWFRDRPLDLADPGDPFIRRWAFTAEGLRVRPGELEFRNDRETTGLLRVGRSGFVVAGEIQRRPAREPLASTGEVVEAISQLTATVCRLLARAEEPRLVPRMICEGLKGGRLRLADGSGDSAACPIDALQVSGPVGDPNDPAYRAELTREFTRRLLQAFHIAGDGHESV